ALWHFYAVMFLVGVVGNGTTQLVWARAVTARFDRQRGVALSLTMAGGGVGALLVPWVTALIISGSGWRWAYLALGCTVILMGPLLAFVALRSHGGGAAATQDGGRPAAGALRSRVFRTLLLAFLLVSVGANGCVAHL